MRTSSAIVHEHRSLCETVRLALSKDQLDVSNLCCMENVVRRLITLEIAVSRNRNALDFSGLEVVAEAPISAHGSAQVSAMQAWVTERLKERANIAKQSRLFREETGKKPKRGDGDEESNLEEAERQRETRRRRGLRRRRWSVDGFVVASVGWTEASGCL